MAQVAAKHTDLASVPQRQQIATVDNIALSNVVSIDVTSTAGNCLLCPETGIGVN